MTKLTERAKAIMEGKTKYFTGEPCIHGHLDDRYTLNGSCVTCVKARSNPYSPRVPTEAEIFRSNLRLMKAVLRSGMSDLKVNLHVEDEEYFRSVVHNLNLIREPRLKHQPSFEKGNRKHLGRQVWSHVYRVFPEDWNPLFHLSMDLAWERMGPGDREFMLKLYRQSPQPHWFGWVPRDTIAA